MTGTMTLREIESHVLRLEDELKLVRDALDMQRAVEGVKRGLASKATGRSRPARAALADLRKKLFPDAAVRAKKRP